METINNLLNNQIFTGLGMATIFGSVLYYLRSTPNLIWRLTVHLSTVRLTVNNSDSSFQWIEAWLSRQSYAKSTRRVNLSTIPTNDEDNNEWVLAPGYGVHRFWWRNRLVILDRSKGEPQAAAGRRPTTHESFTFTTIGRSQQILRDLVDEAKDSMTKCESINIRVWRDWWAPVRGKQPRSLNTIVLQPGQLERIVKDIDWYLKAKEWYLKRGLPYRRGYLFDGLPGTGKTSAVLAIAGHFKMPVCILNLGSVRSDDSLLSAILDAPNNAIIVLEDVDCAVATQSRDRPTSRAQGIDIHEDDDDDSGITKAGLLNVLDGIATPDGRIFIMTTNYPDRLDSALLRPGRVDVRETFEYLKPEEQINLARCFYGDTPFYPLNFRVSPATLQSAFMMFPDSPKKAREYLIKITNGDTRIM